MKYRVNIRSGKTSTWLDLECSTILSGQYVATVAAQQQPELSKCKSTRGFFWPDRKPCMYWVLFLNNYKVVRHFIISSSSYRRTYYLLLRREPECSAILSALFASLIGKSLQYVQETGNLSDNSELISSFYRWVRYVLPTLMVLF